jgi:class 3 adenylate cyclase/tetratricopeptide (TPR) repeat protein
MEEREELEQAITQLETQRESLGDAAVDASLVRLYRKLTELDKSGATNRTENQASEYIGERRVVTVLFCDVAGSTALAESLDPEAWTGIMNTTFDFLIEPVERYGGTVARLMGDAILAFFGAPTAHEDDPQRAVLAGLAIVDNILPYQEKLREEKGLDFNVRVGINTGLAVVGDVGSETAGEYTAMGDAVNLAARMEQTAAPGTVQIAQDTYALVAPLFNFKELGGITVKGKSEPVLAYQVLGRKAEPASLRGLSDQGISSPLVGRESEFESAMGAVDQLLAGQGGILAILGEAGIGKSRLLAELHNNPSIDKSQLTWLEGHTLSYGQTISYWPFQEILRSYAGINEEDEEIEAWRKLESSIGELFQEKTAEILPYLASLLSIEVSGEYAERVKYLDGEALGRQVYRSSRRFFQRLAEQQPLLLLFEDLHWMDASSASLLEHLLPLVERVPLLVCGLSRPDAESPAGKLLQIAEEQYGSRLTEIDLAPLTQNDSRLLVQNLLEIEGLPDSTKQMILEKADGNPFYLEEIVRDLIEKGALERDISTGHWQATQHIEKVTVPDTIQGLLIARIDRLDENLKRVVRRAAVIGRAFLYRILDAVLEEERDLENRVKQLQRVELIREKQQIPELEYIFKHALAQEAAYEGILLQERREVHARVGAAIETLMSDRLEEFYGLLAHHYSAAELWEKAQEYLFKAGDQAGRMAADAEALSHYHQAMEAYARVRGEDWPPFERAQLERKIGEALFRLGEHDQARAYMYRTLALLGEGFPATRWGTRLALMGAILWQAGHRLVPRLFVRPMSGIPDERFQEVFQAGEALGWMEGLVDSERFMLVNLRMLNAAERSGFAYESAHFSSSFGLAADVANQLGLAEMYYGLSSNYAGQITPYRPTLLLKTGLAMHHHRLGLFEKSLEHSLQCAEIAKSMGDLRQWGAGMTWAAWSRLALGRFDEARITCELMVDVAGEGSDRQVLCWGLIPLGVSQRWLGLVDQGIFTLLRALKLAEELPDHGSRMTVSAWLGRSYLDSGQLEQALAVLETGKKMIAVHGDLMGISTFIGNGLSEAYLSAAEGAAGEAHREWMNKARITCKEVLKSAKKHRWVLPEAMLFKGRYEWLRGKPLAAEEWWRRALTEAEALCTRGHEGAIHLEIGRRLGDREHLKQAESILEEIGAEFDLAKAREALMNMADN